MIDGARLVDGTGGPTRAANVAIAGDRVAEVAAAGDLASASAARRVIGAGLTLVPGFIDAHTHGDRAVIDRMLVGRSQGRAQGRSQGGTVERGPP